VIARTIGNIDLFGFVLPKLYQSWQARYVAAALCIERANCKLSSRKGAPLIAVHGYQLKRFIRQEPLRRLRARAGQSIRAVRFDLTLTGYAALLACPDFFSITLYSLSITCRLWRSASPRSA
jgi:hypothetical protein